MDTFGTSHFVLYDEVVHSLEVKMYQYNREGNSSVSFSIQSVHYQRFHNII